jgi:hypothetical protein
MRLPYRTALFASLLALVCRGTVGAYDWFQGVICVQSAHRGVFR